MSKPLHFAMVAGEASGDILGAGLMRALKQQYPDAIFTGIGGPRMLAEGFVSHFPMERLSVMGLVEVLGRLWELLGIRKQLKQRFIAEKPDVFIGIDAPDFNLGLETSLRQAGIKTVHYVSPSVWAWREKRVFKIAKAVDLMLTLFPFEVAFYQTHQVPAVCVGHTLADQFPLIPDVLAARQTLDLVVNGPVLAILPGSRGGEVQRLAPVFLQAAEIIRAQLPNLSIVIPAANDERYAQLQELLAEFPQLNVQLLHGQSREAMAAANGVLMASGTAALEGLLLKKPIVVSYIVAPLTAFLLRRMLKQPFVSLPNLLAGKALVPEILQEQATPENLAAAVLNFLQNDSVRAALQDEFLTIHQSLRLNADERAAQAISELIGHA
jgi:lipid-A-disaccharide synthase